MTSAARDLMDAGTPGPWYALPGDGTFNPSVGAAPAAVPSLLTGDEWVAECKPAGDHDARKIVLTVNALPLVDALIEAINNIEAGADGWGACSHEWVQIHLLTTARDALEAALRGEGS